MATRSPFRTPSSLSALAASVHLGLEVAVGERPGVAGLADPVVGDLVAEAALDMPVDAVVGDVELPAEEPLRERQVPFEGLSNGVNQLIRSRACFAQNASKSASPRRTGRPVALAWAENSADGGNVRASARRFSISGCDDGSTLTVPTSRS